MIKFGGESERDPGHSSDFYDLVEIARDEYERSGRRIDFISSCSKDVLLIWWVEMLISGGGVDLYLNDAASSFNDDFVRLCEKIGALKTAALFGQLSNLFPADRFPLSLDQRRQLVAKFWDEEDDKWGKYQDGFYGELIQAEESLGSLYLIFLRNE